MNCRNCVLVIVIVFLLGNFAFAQGQLDRAEVLQILADLTAQPTDTWISAGTLQVTHTEYKAPKTTDQQVIKDRIKQKISEYLANPNKIERSEELQKMKLDALPYNVKYELSNESTTITNQVVQYDGQRYNWDIQVESHTDSVTAGKELDDNFMKEDFQLQYNAQKTFVFDGEKYAIISPLAEHAFIDAAETLPRNMAAPLTAGVIPWGFGYYTYENLESLDITGYETIVDGKTLIELVINGSDGSVMQFVMDPDKDYAVLSTSKDSCGDSITTIEYINYVNIENNWIPTQIIQENKAADNQLKSRNIWEITNVSLEIPDNSAFAIDVPDETLVEYASEVSPRPLVYKNLQDSPVESVLAKKQIFDVKTGTVKQNCATVAIEYVADQLGGQIDEEALEQLVDDTDNSTNFYQIKQYLEGLGLNCLAVSTDLDTLQTLTDCQIILHFPAKQHFVVVDSITSDSVNIVDLAGNKFFYQIDSGYFQLDWPSGIALLVSDQAIDGQFDLVSDLDLQEIVGSSGYSCTKLLQQENTIFCDETCEGSYYTIYWERWGCESAASGSCSNERMYRISRCACIEDPYDPWRCIVNEDWINYYMWACD